MKNIAYLTLLFFVLMPSMSETKAQSTCTSSEIDKVQEIFTGLFPLIDQLQEEIIATPPISENEYLLLYWSGMFMGGSIEMTLGEISCPEVDPVIDAFIEYSESLALIGSMGIMPHPTNLTFDDNFLELDMPALYVARYAEHYENLDEFRPK